jgi:hypothetical protein
MQATVPPTSLDSVTDPDLQRVIRAWGALPDQVRRMILAALD